MQIINFKRISIILLLILFFITDGQSSHAAVDTAARQVESENKIQIRIEERLNNPYSVQNMQNAFDRYNSETIDSPFQGKALLQATHQYIRINPTTEAHLEALNTLDGSEDGTIVLHDFPLDYEITVEGDYYNNPTDESDLFYPVFTVIPLDYTMPSGLPYEIIEQVYQPKEEEYDVETLSLELMGWKNEDGCRDSEVVCLDSEVIEAEDPIGPQVAPPVTTKAFGRRYRPNGYVMVENTDLANTNPSVKMQPLRQAKISIGRGIWWRYTHTDNNGYFSSPKKYRGKVRIRAKWRSNIATIRKSWNEMLGIQVSDHLMTIRRSSNGRTKNIYFGDDRLWYKSTVHNGLVKYNDFAASNGINKLISGANVWVWKNGSGAAATPMFNHHRNLSSMAAIAGIGQSQVWDVVVNSVASFLINLLPARLQPDMLFTGLKRFNRASGFVSTAEIEQVVFHESGHYSHSRQAGAWHWAKLVSAEISNSILNGGSYSDGSEPSFTAGKHISLAEGWATFVEYKTMLNFYDKVRVSGTNYWTSKSNAISLMDRFDRYTVPMSLNRTDFDSWFMHGIFWDILDSSSDSLARFKNGISGSPIVNEFGGYIRDNLYLPNSNELYPVFSLLKSDVYNACDFGTDLVSAHLANGSAIEDLFHSYGHTCIDGGSGITTPGVPGNFYITNYSNGSNYLDWYSVNQANYYQIYKSSTSSSGSSYYYVRTVNAPTTSWSTYVPSNYYFKVRACNTAGCSNFTSSRLARGSSNDCDDQPIPQSTTSQKQLVDICPVQ